MLAEILLSKEMAMVLYTMAVVAIFTKN